MQHRYQVGYLFMGLLGCFMLSKGEDTLLLTLSLAIYGIAGWTVLRHAGGLVMTPAMIFFLFFTVFIYIGGLGFFFENGAGASYTDSGRSYRFYLALNGGLFATTLGILSASLITRFSPREELARFRARPWEDTYQTAGDYVTVALIGTGALLMTLLYIQKQGFVPLLEILKTQDSADVYDLAFTYRAEFSRYGRGAGTYFFQGYFQQFYLIILPFVTLYVGSKYLHYRKISLLGLWLALALVCSFFLAMSLQRWPLMFFIVLNYILYAGYGGKIKISHAIVFAALALSLFGLLTYLRGIADLEMLAGWVQTRIIRTQVDVFYSTVEMFPRHFAFYGGTAFLGDIKGVLPGPDPSFASWLFNAMYRAHGNGTAPTIFWGQLYADFGLSGVVVGAFVGGMIMQGTYISLLRGKKNLIRLVVYAILIMALGELAVANIISVLLQFGVVTLFLLLAMINISRWLFGARPVLFPAGANMVGRNC